MKKTLLQITFLLSALFLFINGNILGQIAPGSYTIGTTGTENYSSLKAACDDVNTNGIGGDVTFLITTDLHESDDVGLIQTSVHTLTIKPAADKSPTIYFEHSTDNTAPSGGWLLGITDPSDWANVGKCINIVIDGSNNGTNSKDLTLTNGGTAHYNTYPLVLVGDVSNVTIKNCNIVTALSVSKAVMIRTDAPNYPHDITFDNCNISCNTNAAGAAVYGYYHGDHTAYSTNLEFKNCAISARLRGFFLYQMEDVTIHDNEIKIDDTDNGYLAHGIYAYAYLNGSDSDIEIYNNKFTQLQTANSYSGDYGIRAIQCNNSNVHYNIYNNFIAGFNTTTTASNPSCQLYGIYAHSYNYVNVYNNTIYLPDLQTDFGTGTPDMRGITLLHSPKTLKNNIIYVNEGDFDAYCIYKAGTTTLTTDYNDLYLNDASTGYVGYDDSVSCRTLSDWQAQIKQDSNSVSKKVYFSNASIADLHLTGSSIGDGDLAGVALTSVTTDIDGDTRNDPPYMGADENSTTPAPVELTTFSASIVDGGVLLTWATATEVNNYGFEIEKSVNGEEWEYVDFVEGHGNSNIPQNYTYLDASPIVGKVVYRLKQVDNDGGYEYSNEASVVSNEAVYKLNQNYPNPFNPTTVIGFSLKVSSKVTLTVYNALGQEVAVLANEVMDAGYHEVTFNATGLASGFYVYRLDAPGFSKTMKMMLLK